MSSAPLVETLRLESAGWAREGVSVVSILCLGPWQDAPRALQYLSA